MLIESRRVGLGNGTSTDTETPVYIFTYVGNKPDAMNVEPNSTGTLRDESGLLQGVVDPFDRVTSHGEQKATE